jgi:electron transfer flavoprotein alpha subunit
MTRVLVIAELDGPQLAPVTACTVQCAHQIGAEALDLAVMATDGGEAASEAAALDGVSRVLLLNNPAFADCLAEILAPAISTLAADYTHVLAPGTTFGRDVLPRVAALLGVGQISDIVAVDGPYRFRRPAYAGNAIITLAADPARPLLGTVRASAWSPAGKQSPVAVVRADSVVPADSRSVQVTGSRFPGLRMGEKIRPTLSGAQRVVCVGRGIGDGDGLARAQALADALNGALGASRAVVDAGLAANELQIGQTGKVIAPELYIGLGVSGAIQHLTGIRDARTIVAINNDPEAPIMQVADIALLADLAEAVPELLAQLTGDSPVKP